MCHQTIVVRSAPTAEERLPGYLLRIADINGYSGPRDVLSNALTKFGNIAAPHAIEEVARLLGLPLATATNLAYIRSGKSNLRFFGHEVPCRRVSWVNPRLCPLCLRDQEVISCLWDLRFIQACPFHGCQLLRHCQTCGQPLTWHRTSLVRCRCDSDFRKQQTPRASHSAIQVSRRLAIACGLNGVPAPTGFDTALLDLNDLLFLINFFGGRARGASADQEHTQRQTLGQEAIVESAGRLFENPAPIIIEIIDRRAENQPNYKIGNLIKFYFNSVNKYNHPRAKDLLDQLQSAARSYFNVR
ncbi:hypothetical protein FHR20_002278 [Sphingomonas leidyi]|uniref:TniQ domain-containing protein n=1 Tax=Sphingomonas leidyi TaxID=68569 RepID=A0A7X5UZX6_9SPHN|nr:hypothetical protein [Sphingomonas leidyi]